ncbi:hypothetical protein NAT51_18495 [Flavobacterium amniphilum]|uniref:hypothetical protein n=1 Tax=Flavobacterium amniphilum TaxID=1834035 RepID=UPI00202A9E29|nr:hypothetical protein [Flavobacterium amniphilum]MCL9807522.1 hypothetical protein [Flavobacterium amniphilum]
MKKLSKIVFCLILFQATLVQAQEELSQNDIDSLYVKALTERIDWQLSSGYKYVDLEDQTNIPENKFQNGMIKILPRNQIISISRKQGKELTVYTLDYSIISKDTVDINFHQYYLKGLKTKNKKSPLAIISENKCRQPGTSYIPDIRFALVDKRWKIIQSKFQKH